jgi:HEAT repeat protein
MPQHWLGRHWRKLLLAGIGGVLLAYVALSLLIGHQVGSAIAAAQARQGGGSVTALLAVVRSSEAPLEERNRAIWALGQLGAREALPELETLLTGEACDHEHELCQRELRKAVALCSGGTNVGAVVWRHGDLAAR